MNSTAPPTNAMIVSFAEEFVKGISAAVFVVAFVVAAVIASAVIAVVATAAIAVVVVVAAVVTLASAFHGPFAALAIAFDDKLLDASSDHPPVLQNRSLDIS